MPSMRFLYTALAAALLLPLSVSEGAGQGQTTGSIRGRITSAEGGAVVSAQVVAINTETGLRRGSLSDAQGRYSVLLLPPGTYRVEAQSLGFATAVADAVRVLIGETTPVDLALRTEAVAIEGITVTGERATIDPAQGGVRQTITPEQVENLPTQGRDFTDLINLSPLVSPQPGTGTGGQFSIAGARTSGTNVQVDGVDANNQFFGENRGSSRTPFAFSLESIKELQLITNGFDVEYGNYTGGVVNAVTKGGTNALRGSAFLFFRDEALTANDFLDQEPTDFSVRQFGANVSGPIVRDKLHFFASADVQRKNQPIFPGSEIPDAQLAAAIQALEAKGLPNASRFFGQHDQAEDNMVLFGRLDWTISGNHRLTVRQNYSDFEQTNDRISREEALTHGGPFVNQAWSTVGEVNSVFGGNILNTLRVQYSAEDRPRNPNQPGGYLPQIGIDLGDEFLEFGGDGIIFRNRLVEDKIQLVDNLIFTRGAHTFKIGTNNTWSNTQNTFWLLGNGTYTFRSLEDFVAGRPSSYFRLTRACPVPLQPNRAGEPVICPDPDVPEATFSALEWSVYAQDEWRVNDRLLLVPGIRYGGTRFPDEPGELPAVEAAFGIPTGVVPDFSGISPRFALTFDPNGDETSIVRGGVGLLVGRIPTVLVGNVFQTERPLLVVSCSSRRGNVPTFDLEELLAAERGLANPIACAGGEAPFGQPEHAVFADDFELPQTLKTNLGYERVLGGDLTVGVDLLYSRTWNNFNVVDANLGAEQFRLGLEGRPVFVEPGDFEPDRGASFGDRVANRSFRNIYVNRSDAEAESYSVAIEADKKFGDVLQFGTRYAFTKADDNSSFSCCTSGEGFGGSPTAGDPNFIGDPGDDVNGAWGPSNFERRHAFVTNVVYRAPYGLLLTGIWRSQSGTPFTPVVRGDVNADAVQFNDRAFISRDLMFETPEDAETFGRLLGEFDCLESQLGRIASRNSCRNPWFHSVDLRLAKEIQTFRGQRAELLVDVFNLLNGLNDDWGRFTFVGETDLLQAEGFDAATQRVIYSVNPEFGEERPVGFDPFQFQVQLGVRYRF